jgi:membrane fusion protein (multidrug efflux system)
MNINSLPSALALILLAAGAGCRSRTEEPLKPPPAAIQVETAVITTRSMPRSLPLTGSLVAAQQADVAANVGGRVIRTFVDRGALVQKGDVLVKLDIRAAQLSEDVAKANFESAQAQQRLADMQCRRNQDLLKKGALSREEWERVESQCRISAATAEAAAAQAALAKKTLRDATVRAPFSGLIGDRFVSVGEYVQPASKVASIVQTSPLRLQLSAPEEYVGHVTPNGEVTFQVVAYPKETFTGIINYIAPAVRPTSRDLIFDALVPNEDGRLRPGMFATAALKLPDEPLPAVPRSSLWTQDASHRLLMVTDGHIEERVVQIGSERDGYVVVLDGARAGERFVLEPSDKVKDGVAVLDKR